MEVGDKVLISGTKLRGEIIEKKLVRRPLKKSLLSLFTVKHEDGSTMDYGREELRYNPPIQ